MLGNCETPYFQNPVVQYKQYHKQGALEPPVLGEVFSSLAPLRVTSSASVPSVDMVYIVQRSVTKSEFRKCLVDDALERSNL